MSSHLPDENDMGISNRREMLFERVLQSLPDGVLINDLERRIVYTNPAFAKHWGIPPELLASRDDLAMLAFVNGQLADGKTFRFEVERLHLSSESSEDEIHLKDGRVFSRKSVPFKEAGATQGRIWIFSDVTDAKSALLDELTGIGNRRAFSREFPRYARADDDGLQRSVAMMDVDNFKRFNDFYGHAAGDAVLVRIGQIIRAHLTAADDSAFRIGGEEFLLASRARSVTSAFSFFDALRRSIDEMSLPHCGNAPHPNVTVSIGVGTFRSPKDPGFVFDRVDAALYQAKFGGRNLTVHVAM